MPSTSDDSTNWASRGKGDQSETLAEERQLHCKIIHTLPKSRFWRSCFRIQKYNRPQSPHIMPVLSSSESIWSSSCQSAAPFSSSFRRGSSQPLAFPV